MKRRIRKRPQGTGVTQGLLFSDDIEIVQHEHRGKNEKDRLSAEYHRASYLPLQRDLGSAASVNATLLLGR